MKTETEIIDLLQMMLDRMDQDYNDDADLYRLWYGKCIKSLAILSWLDASNYWVRGKE